MFINHINNSNRQIFDDYSEPLNIDQIFNLTMMMDRQQHLHQHQLITATTTTITPIRSSSS
ncbi:hypothetical protein DERF_011684 [Dermatophagoides farinae]|uniref:Uncharacterized protein n=1 Tax=Dermatophagoides farinae TaxID=6954 RepID=A0A922L510_DERFA|nr:hypothetical protein DERF_011684 [Dermatophagoides farinae]